MARGLPEDTVTTLFTNVVGSTQPTNRPEDDAVLATKSAAPRC